MLLPRRPRTATVLGWLIAVGGPLCAVELASRADQDTAWTIAGAALVVVVVTWLSGFLAGASAAALAAALAWLVLDSGSGSGTDRNDGLLELGLVLGGGALAFYVEAARELRVRSRLRSGWLDRLTALAKELAAIDESLSPSAASEMALHAAVRAAGASSGSLLRAEPGIDRSGRSVVLSLPGCRSARAVELELDRTGLPSRLAAEHATFLRSIADQTAQVLERHDVQLAEQNARADLEFLARASAALASSLDVERVVSALDDLAIPYVADSCSLTLARRFGQPRVEQTPPPPDDDTTRTIELWSRDREVGRLTLVRHNRRFEPADDAIATQLAERAAQALDHALLFAEQSTTSATLEHSLLPETLLPVEHLEVAARYLAAGEGHAAGGDFYDALRMPDGGAVLLMGDVQGKGVNAATLTSVARHTLRAAAFGGLEPAAMLARLNAALLYGHEERMATRGRPTVQFVTAAVIALTPTETGFHAVVAGGGHPPPLVIRSDGSVQQIETEGPLLGVFSDPVFEQPSVELSLSDMLVLYTDGVTEQRETPGLFDELQLGRLIRNQLTERTADAIAQLILDTVIELAPRDARDDIALLVARVTGPR